MAQSIVSPVASKLGSLLTDEVKFLCGVNDKIKSLQDEFKWMQCFLEDVNARQDGDERFRNWVAQITEIAYDVDDIIDIFNIKVGSRRSEGCMSFMQRCARIFKEACTLHELGSSIEDITTRISNLTRQLQTYGVRESTQRESSSTLHERKDGRRSYAHILEHNVVGLDQNIQELVHVLVGDEKRFHIVLVWGMGGIGKTTFAKKIYHDGQVRHHFDRFAWAYVSQQCQTRKVWEEIAFGLVPEQRNEIKNLEDAELPGKLHQILQENKCLVILDDIWRSEDWNNLKVAFPNGETSSVILVTTRNKEIASHQNRFLHEMQLLNEDDGWELLQKIAIPEKSLEKDFEIDSKREEFGKEIIRQCNGLPLAITVVGGILTINNSLNEWEMMHANMKSIMAKTKSNDGGNLRVYDILALSYTYLPSHLKPCFLYLGHFPEDYAISVTKLIQLWIAEGFITSNQIENREETMEDVGQSYMKELIERCTVLVAEMELGLDRVKSCRLHDLMRDFCLSKAKEEKFLFVFDCQHGVANSCPHDSCSKIGRAHRFASHQFVLMQSISGSRLNPRALLQFNQCRDDFEDDIDGLLKTTCYVLKVRRSFNLVVDKFKMLRVLDYTNSLVPFPLKNIDKLVHLRYLCLRDSQLCKLPSSLGNLKLLQTLDLRVFPLSSLYIPDIFWKIPGLRHLYLPQQLFWSIKTRLHFRSLIHLQTLVNFVIPNCDVNDLLNLINLKELNMIVQPGQFRKTWHQVMIKLVHLRSLCLLSASKTPHNLLELPSCELLEDPMPTLEKLPKLKVLVLEYPFSGNKMVCSSQSFPNLQSLSLMGLENLEEWSVNEKALPCLRSLTIRYCQKLKFLPEGLRFITSLQDLIILSMLNSFKSKLVEGGGDFYKIQHVPHVVMDIRD